MSAFGQQLPTGANVQFFGNLVLSHAGVVLQHTQDPDIERFSVQADPAKPQYRALIAPHDRLTTQACLSSRS